MKAFEHFTKLCETMSLGAGDGLFRGVTTEELAGILHCSERNVKLLLRKWERDGWVKWQAGQGRGHRSAIRLLTNPQRLRLERVGAKAALGELQEALSLLQTEELQREERDRLLGSIMQAFGYHKELGKVSKEGTLRIPSYRELPDIDPARAVRRTEQHMALQLFDRLVRFDASSGMFVPWLAHHWESNAAGDCWRFYLQRGVSFHHGRELIADDVVYTLDRLSGDAAASIYKDVYAAQIKMAIVVEDHVLELRLRESNWQILSLLAAPAAGIVPRDRMEAGSAEFARLPIGTGAFKATYHDEQRLVLEAADRYWMRRAHLDRIELWFLPHLYEGEMNESELEQQLDGFQVRTYPYGSPDPAIWRQHRQIDQGCKLLTLRAADPGGPLGTAAVRERLLAALDRTALIADLGGNRAVVAHGVIRELEPSAAALPSPAPGSAAGDAAAAEPLSLVLATYGGAGNESDAAWIRDRAALAGLEIQVRVLPYDSFVQPHNIATADLLLIEQPVTEDAEWTLVSLFNSESSPLVQHLAPNHRKELRLLFHQLQQEPDRSQRLQLWQHMERKLLLDHAYLCLYRWQQSASFPTELQGGALNALGWVDYRHLWFRSARQPI